MRASGAFVVLLLHGANGTNPKHSPPPVDEESIAERWCQTGVDARACVDKYGLANYIRYQTGRHTESTAGYLTKRKEFSPGLSLLFRSVAEGQLCLLLACYWCCSRVPERCEGGSVHLHAFVV